MFVYPPIICAGVLVRASSRSTLRLLYLYRLPPKYRLQYRLYGRNHLAQVPSTSKVSSTVYYVQPPSSSCKLLLLILILILDIFLLPSGVNMRTGVFLLSSDDHCSMDTVPDH